MSGMNQGVPSPYNMQMEGGPPIRDMQTMMWTQGQWAQVDSGIQSGAPSAAPSVMSGASSLHNDLLGNYGDPYTPGYTLQEHADEINEHYNASRSQRIRQAMFPETMEEGLNDSLPMGVDVGQSSNVQRLTEPSQMLKTAVVNLINYQDDAELATRAIPELIKLLSDEDQVVVGHAAMMVHQLSKKDAPLRAMMGSANLIQALVRAMTATDDTNISKYAAGTLFNMSSHQPGLMAIFQSGGIRALVRLLDSPVDSIVFYALTTLHNLLLHQDGAKDTVRHEGGVEKMVRLLDKPIEKFLAIDTDCLQLLCFKHQPTKLQVLHAGGPERLVHIMRTFQYEKLLWTTSRLLKVLSVCNQNKTRIVAAGGMQALQPHLINMPSSRLVKNCLWALRNMSDAATKEDNMTDLVRSVIQQLGSSDHDVVDCCVGILSNLTCNNPRNKMTFCESNGIELMLRTLEVHMNDMDIAESGLCTLRHVTSRHENAPQAQTQLKLEKGIPIVANLIRNRHPPVVKTALGVVRNLATNDTCIGDLHQIGAHMGALDALKTAITEIENSHAQNREPPVMEGVTMIEIVEMSCCALQFLAKYQNMRIDLIKNGATRFLVLALRYKVEHVLRPSTATLSELAMVPEAALAIEREGAIPHLTELLNSGNEGLATYASGVLMRIQEGKPKEYQDRMNTHMSNALCRDDSAPWTQDGLNEMHAIPGDESYSDMMHYGQASYDPSLSMEQMQLGSPAVGGPWPSANNMYGVPPPPAPHMQQQQQQQQQHQQGAGQMQGGWYDTDL